jgi:imidazolonepropionase-like amidohydrolase
LVNAEIVRQEGRLGELVPGAFADLLVVDGDPYRDLGVFRSDGGRLDVIMANGVMVKNRL